jgi:A/G-specific adenine glycosylase
MPTERRIAEHAALSPSPVVFRKALLGWYEKAGRHGLPWRKKWSLYHVLVSEFMLQQTTVATVLPYFDRFLKEFTTLESLAAARLERVLELWSGLGYYARARNLHAAAQRLVNEHGGRLPKDPALVMDLPGVGKYTAGALLSFVHDAPQALVDGNVIRVLSRVYGVTEDVKEPAVVENLWALAWKLVPPSGARHYNSALMDLGAQVCRPSSPDCLVCPLFDPCWARRHGKQEELPRSESAAARKAVHVVTALLRRNGKWALVRRPAKGLYGGLWEFPGETVSGTVADDAWAPRLLQKALGAPVRTREALPVVKHVLSHREIHVHPWICEPTGVGALAKGKAVVADGEGESGWYTLREIERMAISSLTRRVVERLKVREQNEGAAKAAVRRP